MGGRDTPDSIRGIAAITAITARVGAGPDTSDSFDRIIRRSPNPLFRRMQLSVIVCVLHLTHAPPCVARRAGSSSLEMRFRSGTRAKGIVMSKKFSRATAAIAALVLALSCARAQA